jgi:transposase InsO family protein
MNTSRQEIPLPKGWPGLAGKAMISALGMMRVTVAHLRDWSLNHDNPGIAREGEIERLKTENRALLEVIAIVHERMKRMPSLPQYTPSQRARALELKAMTGWTNDKLASLLLLAGPTVGRWKRVFLDAEDGLCRLVRFIPVNKFPELLDRFVETLNSLCPHFGKTRIANLLIRAGLHVADSSVGRRMRRKPGRPPTLIETLDADDGPKDDGTVRVVTAKRPGHLAHCDFTIVPNVGLWVPWYPESLPQVYPYVYWVGTVVDHFSRKELGYCVLHKEPTKEETVDFLERVFRRHGLPDHMVTDKGGYFDCAHYKDWCADLGIKPRFGKVHEHGSVAVVERFIKTMKVEGVKFAEATQDEERFREELDLFQVWYNEYRPHEYLDGRTPNEVWNEVEVPAIERPRIEIRPNWPKESGCAKPTVPMDGEPGAEPILEIALLEGRRHLPIVRLVLPDAA